MRCIGLRLRTQALQRVDWPSHSASLVGERESLRGWIIHCQAQGLLGKLLRRRANVSDGVMKVSLVMKGLNTKIPKNTDLVANNQ